MCCAIILAVLIVVLICLLRAATSPEIHPLSVVVPPQLVAIEKAQIRSSIEEDEQWRQKTLDALLMSEGLLGKLSNVIVKGSNKSTELLNAASHVDTPDRFSLNIIETNPQGNERQISIKYRPLRSWMKQDGMKGVGLKILSHLQMAGHWAVTIGPYTYDIYQDNGRVVFNAGKWSSNRTGEVHRVKVRHVGFTKKTDTEIYTSACAAYELMRLDPYDVEFNNCHRFAALLASRISNHQTVKIHVRLIYTWHLMPASYIFRTKDYLKQYLRVGKRVILNLIFSDLNKHGFEWTVVWRVVKKQGLVASGLIYFLLTAGLMNVFLNMAKALLGWDSDTPEGREMYRSLFKVIPGFVTDDQAENYLKFAFEGPKGVKAVMDKLLAFPPPRPRSRSY